MDAKTTIALGDPALFRQQCYVNGGWTDARSFCPNGVFAGAFTPVNNLDAMPLESARSTTY